MRWANIRIAVGCEVAVMPGVETCFIYTMLGALIHPTQDGISLLPALHIQGIGPAVRLKNKEGRIGFPLNCAMHSQACQDWRLQSA